MFPFQIKIVPGLYDHLLSCFLTLWDIMRLRHQNPGRTLLALVAGIIKGTKEAPASWAGEFIRFSSTSLAFRVAQISETEVPSNRKFVNMLKQKSRVFIFVKLKSLRTAHFSEICFSDKCHRQSPTWPFSSFLPFCRQTFTTTRWISFFARPKTSSGSVNALSCVARRDQRTGHDWDDVFWCW